ncbi:MAG: aldehyde dehydrogenase family protein [Acidimicrobiia bacterium]|nr:aldehyde dehydrogenase family protein [Acidimicrobiia bacterium]
MRTQDKLYIDGAWVPSTGSDMIEVINPSTEKVCGSVPEGTAEDVDRAVAAARRAFDGGWGQTTVEERRKAVARLAEALEARSSELGDLLATEMGMPSLYANLIQAGLPVANTKAHVELMDQVAWEETVGNSLVVRDPVGVVGAITPWNYPLHQIMCKVAPALAAGCTVVLKPSEVAPLNAFVLAEAIDEAGFPAGVFNLVTGFGPVVGEAIAAHPDVDMVSFTGSTRAGKRVAEVASATVKKVHLELGGKSANVILDDADLEACVPPGVTFGCYLNSGQTCTALTRMIVPRALQDQVVELARQAAESTAVGPADQEGAQIGPLVSAAQRDRVRSYIQTGIDEGAVLVAGGVEAPEGLDTGYFVQPTVFAEVTPDMTIAREEIFGPVLSIMPYDTEEEALAIAEDTDYGLAGGVQAGSVERAMAFARRMRAGQVDVNGGAFNLLAPFGGFKQSGTGREKGRWGIEEFTELKSIQLPG